LFDEEAHGILNPQLRLGYWRTPSSSSSPLFLLISGQSIATDAIGVSVNSITTAHFYQPASEPPIDIYSGGGC